MSPPQHDETGLEDGLGQGPQRDRDGVGGERARDVAVRSGLERLGEELGRDDQEDHHQDEEPGPPQGETRRPVDQPALGHVGERDVDADGHEVLDGHQQDPDLSIERPRGDPLDEAPGDDVDVPDEQQGRAEEQQIVERADPALPEHAGLEEGVADDAPRTRRDRPAEIGPDRLDGLEDPQAPDHEQREDRERAPEDREHERVRGDLREHLEDARTSSSCAVFLSVPVFGIGLRPGGRAPAVRRS